MNTRVQVEHCVTEATTGIDIVREQIRIAAGEPLSVAQDEVVLRGHAIECRINAEDAAKNFAPAPGTVTRYREPSGPGVRVDSGVIAGSEITPLYDPMVAKLIVWDVDRETATRRMARALEEFDIDGVRTLIPFHKAIMASEQWAAAETCRDLIEDRDWLKTLAFERRRRRAATTEEAEPLERSYTVEVSGKRFDVRVLGDAIAAPAGGNSAAPAAARPRRERKASGGGGGGGGDTLASPLQGNVFKVLVEQGATVEEGALVCIIEAMKMENEITAHKAGVVAELPISEGAAVTVGATLAVIRSPGVATRSTFSAWIFAWRRCGARAAAGRPRRAPAAPAGRPGPRAGCASARAPSSGAPWPGTTYAALLDQRLEPVERGEVGGRRARTPRSTGSRPARGSRRTTSTDAHGTQTAMPSTVCPSAGCSSSSRSPIAQCPGTGSACGAGQHERRRPLDVVLLVEVAQLALRGARLVAQPRGARLGQPERRVAERVAAEQVVPVGVRRQAADDAELGLRRHRRQQLELVGQHRRVDAERLLARPHERAGRLPEARRDDDDVGMEPDGLHGPTRRRAASPPRGGS